MDASVPMPHFWMALSNPEYVLVPVAVARAAPMPVSGALVFAISPWGPPWLLCGQMAAALLPPIMSS
jgi:hypothetical protein